MNSEKMDNELPEGWEYRQLGEIGNYINGKAFKPSDWATKGRPIIRIQDLTHTKSNPNYYDGIIEDRYVVHPGDFLISWSATLGAYIWDGPEAVLNQHIFRVDSYIHKRFHKFLIDFILDDLQRETHGSGMVHVTKGKFDNIVAPIPPLAEQKRIVARLEELLPQVDAVKQRLGRASRIMRRFRQAVLNAACSGKLTEGWRDSYSDRLAPVEASDYQQLSTVDLPEIPQEWAYVSLGSRTIKCQYGTSVKASDQCEGNVPILRMGNIQDGSIDYSQLKYVKLSNEIKPFIVEKGDFLFNRTNSPELVGKSAIFDSDKQMVFASYLIRLRFDKEEINPEYVCFWVSSDTGRAWASAVKTDGVSQSNINAKKLQLMPLPLPSKQEQDEIVRRMEALFSLADTIEKQIEKAKQKVEKLSQSILAKAFRGELVPTEAEIARQEGRSYEAASVLLEQIKTEREKTTRHSPEKQTNRSLQRVRRG